MEPWAAAGGVLFSSIWSLLHQPEVETSWPPAEEEPCNSVGEAMTMLVNAVIEIRRPERNFMVKKGRGDVVKCEVCGEKVPCLLYINPLAAKFHT